MLYLFQREKEKDFTRLLAQIKLALTNKLSSQISPSERKKKSKNKLTKTPHKTPLTFDTTKMLEKNFKTIKKQKPTQTNQLCQQVFPFCSETTEEQ